MKRRTFLQSCATAMAVLGQAGRSAQSGAASLEEGFVAPPESARPKTWWHWMNGNVSREGITLDLEAMKRVGVRGVQLFQVSSGIPKGPVPYGTPANLELVRHAIREAGRLGMELDLHNCPGWSSSGGPWVPPELSMQQLVWTETSVRGGVRVSVSLPRPPARAGYYRDAMVVAFPSLPGEARPLRDLLSRAAVNGAPVDAGRITAGGDSAGVEVTPFGSSGLGYLELEFAEVMAVRSVSVVSEPVLSPAPGLAFGSGVPLVLECSEDGRQYRKVCDIPIESGFFAALFGPSLAPADASFAAVQARYFRIVTRQPRRIRDVKLSGAVRIPNWQSKANFIGPGLGSYGPEGPAPAWEVPAEPGSVIDPAGIVDLTARMNPQGHLEWEAPSGNWTVLRFGQTSTGKQNSPAPDGGEGLECDKFSREAFDHHFRNFFGELLEALRPLAERGMAGTLIDSYEAGMQNWTASFPEEFRRRRGYDLWRYMPAMTGRIVGSREIAERFLWDVRRTQAELVSENYYGRFAELCRQHLLQCYIEPYDAGMFDEMECGGQADVPMGEFWLGQRNHRSVKLAASVGHVYGKRVVAAESFTSVTRWQEYPFAMKAVGDFMFTQGLNQYIFHRYAHQPHPDARPGMTMGPWGWSFERTNTWFEQAGGWLDYICRCQFLLQQGLFVADLLYFTGEDSPVVTLPQEMLDPQPPSGYDWDTIDRRALLTRVSVEGGRIRLPDGMSYRALVLPNRRTMTLALLRRLRELVAAGMVLVGPRPESSPSLAEDSAEVQRLAGELWGELDGTLRTERRFGRGHVYWGVSLSEVLRRLGALPDVTITSRSGDAPVNWIHRRSAEADVYFVANRRRQAEEIVCTFRVEGRAPELWDPATGRITHGIVFERVSGGTRLPLRLDPAGSVFVVFRAPAPERHLVSVDKGETRILSAQPYHAPKRGRHGEAANDFTISVWVKPDFDIALTPAGAEEGGSFSFAAASYVFYPPAGEQVYGPGHAACGLAAGRNGIVVYERRRGRPVAVISSATPLDGWTHVALVYRDAKPSLYVRGKLLAQAGGSGGTVHPGLDEAFQEDGAAYFAGHYAKPELFAEVLSESRIHELASGGIPAPEGPPDLELYPGTRGSALFWENGTYVLHDSAGGSRAVEVRGIERPREIRGPWRVSFPAGAGAPPEVVLPELTSLHRHPDPGVRYFSGTATYRNQISLARRPRGERRLFLDLGWVEVMAEVRWNGVLVGRLWKPPYRLDVTEATSEGPNQIEIRVTNLWPNRLIGDEQLPEEYDYGGGGLFAMISASGGIREIPEWFARGRPRPASRRVAFSTWKHYTKGSPLLESGLLGPVKLLSAVARAVPL
ncbi:MAG: hypothetical protein K6T59_04730 [Bryobacteraceae bacterium]|nr:hypothetical protein [Bryobacteraceae bacterium]